MSSPSSSPSAQPPQTRWLEQLLRLLRTILTTLSPTKSRVSQDEARRTASQFVRAGATDSEVKRILGSPDLIEADQWIYFVDPRRGWSIVFTPANTVERIDYWVR